VRQRLNPLLRLFMAERFRDFRMEQHFTQEQMSEKLWISPRSYIDLEHGRYRCSMMTAFLFLLCLEDDEVLHFVHDFRDLVQKETEHEAFKRSSDHNRHLQYPV